MEVGRTQVTVLPSNGLAIDGCRTNGAERGAAFGESADSGVAPYCEGFVELNAGAADEALEFVAPVGDDGFNAGWLLTSPFKGSRGGEAAVGSTLHGFGELKSDDVARALVVLEP